MTVDTVLSQPVLSFLSVLIWQALALLAFLALREEIRGLLDRISQITWGDKSIITQRPSEEATRVPASAAEDMDLLRKGGFLTKEAITGLVDETVRMGGSGEKVVDAILIFETSRQHTWIIGTNKRLFCLLDDEKTRSNKRLIQWSMALKVASPVEATAVKESVGRVKIGPRRGWLYSRDIFPDPADIEGDITALINRAQAGT